MEMRQLTSVDVFSMVNIISKIGLNEFKQSFNSDEVANLIRKGKENAESDVVTKVGVAISFDIINIIMKNLPKCQAEIYEFMASVTDTSVKELEKISITEFTQLVIDFFKKEELKDFFEVVSELLK